LRTLPKPNRNVSPMTVPMLTVTERTTAAWSAAGRVEMSDLAVVIDRHTSAVDLRNLGGEASGAHVCLVMKMTLVGVA
jgi:hypothetical protein